MGINTFDNKKAIKLAHQQANAIMTENSLKARVNKYSCPYQSSIAAFVNGTSIAAGKVRLIPFVVSYQVKMTEMGLVLVSNGLVATSRFRFGIYSCGEDSVIPQKLLLQTPEATANSTNSAYMVRNLDVTLAAGIYYFALITNALSITPLTFRGIPLASLQNILGFNSLTDSAPYNRIEAANSFSNGLPDPFPANYTLLNTAFVPDFFSFLTQPV